MLGGNLKLARVRHVVWGNLKLPRVRYVGWGHFKDAKSGYKYSLVIFKNNRFKITVDSK
jgi:hypothetical protein